MFVFTQADTVAIEELETRPVGDSNRLDKGPDLREEAVRTSTFSGCIRQPIHPETVRCLPCQDAETAL